MAKITHQAVSNTEHQIIETLRLFMPLGATEQALTVSTGMERRTVNNYLRKLAADGHAYKTGKHWRLRGEIIVAEQVAALATTLRQLPAEDRLYWITRLLQSLDQGG